jgi:hypothetical protein
MRFRTKLHSSASQQKSNKVMNVSSSASGDVDDVVRSLCLVSLEASPTVEDCVEKIRETDAVNNLRWHPNGKIFFTHEPRNVSLSLYQKQGSYWEARLINPDSCDSSIVLPIRRPGTWDKETRHVLYKSTVAVLHQGSHLALLASVSGWSNISLIEHQLDQTHWTYKAFRLCKDIKHNLAKDPRDDCIDGRFHASHAEKHLLTSVYFERFKKGLGSTTTTMPPTLNLYTSQAPCNDCQHFFQSFVNFTGCRMTVTYGEGEPTVYTPKKRIRRKIKVEFAD